MVTKLLSPGQEITISDESFYATPTIGTVPLVVVATAANKKSGSGNAVATATIGGGAKLFQVNSQRELLQLFGDPYFETVGGNVVQDNFKNEYGLQAAYDFLERNSRVWILRADVAVDQLEPSGGAPKGSPNGDYWLDLEKSVVNAYEWDNTARKWNKITLKVPVSTDSTNSSGLQVTNSTGVPVGTFGDPDDFAITEFNGQIKIFKNDTGTWNDVAIKDSVASVEDLPTTSNTDGDVRIVSSGTAFSFARRQRNGTYRNVDLSFMEGADEDARDTAAENLGLSYYIAVVDATEDYLSIRKLGNDNTWSAITDLQSISEVIEGTLWNHESTAGDPTSRALKKANNGGGFTTAGLTDYTGATAHTDYIQAKIVEAINKTEELLQETVEFSLMAAPSFHQRNVSDELIKLNNRKDQLAFVIGDVPRDRTPANIADWANTGANGGNVPLGDGAEFFGVYYPGWGLTTNTKGQNVLMPASSFMMQVFADNDATSYPWFAPAGLNRGVLPSSVRSVGYMDGKTYKAVALHQGQRDKLYPANINPIARFPDSGLTVWGQKTRLGKTTALDRINVARLINYLNDAFNRATRPFFFEPNDDETRRIARSTFNDILADVQNKRGLEDFAVRCDSTNNTPQDIDNNVLNIDVAIIPAKSVEFIYIGVRIRNQTSGLGEDFE